MLQIPATIVGTCDELHALRGLLEDTSGESRDDKSRLGALATSVLTPIESPIRDFLRSQPACVAYAERMRARFFPDLATAPARQAAARTKGSARAAQVGV